MILYSALRAIPPPCLFIGFIFGEFLHFWIIFAMGFSRFWEAKVVIFDHFGSPAAPFGGSGPISTIFGFVVILGAFGDERLFPF